MKSKKYADPSAKREELTPLTFDYFRRCLAIKLEKATHPHLVRCRCLLANVDYEGPELFNVSSTSIHAAWELYMLDMDTDTFDEWYDDDVGRTVLHDWCIDMHPGLCPDDVVKAVKEVTKR